MTLYNLLDKYLTWAKFDWCQMIETDKRLSFYDLEEHKMRSLNYILNCIFDNGMLDECYTKNELIELMNYMSTEELKQEINYYLEEI